MGLCVAPLYRGWGRCWTDMNTTAAAVAKIQKNHRQEGGGCQWWSREKVPETWTQQLSSSVTSNKRADSSPVISFFENVKKMVIKSLFFQGAKWRSTTNTQNKQWHLNGRPKDPARFFRSHEPGWCHACWHHHPAGQAQPPKSVLSSHHLSECGNLWVSLTLIQSLNYLARLKAISLKWLYEQRFDRVAHWWIFGLQVWHYKPS